jgi:hypothetical protein
MKVEQIYILLKPGGIGYDDRLLRIKRKYYLLDGYSKGYNEAIKYLYEKKLLIKPYPGVGSYTYTLASPRVKSKENYRI